MTKHKGFSKEERIFLALLGATQFSHIVDFVIMMPLGPVIMRSLDITPQQFSLLVSSYTLSAALSAVLSTFFADRFDRKQYLMFFYVGFIIGTFACSLSRSFETLLISRCVAGLFGGVIGSIVFAIASDYFPFERRGTALGVIMGSFAIASVVGVPLGLYLASHFDWHVPFSSLAAVASVVLAVIYFQIPSMRNHMHHSTDGKGRETPKELFQRILSSPPQLIALAFMFSLTMGQFSIIPFVSPSLVLNAGVHENQLHYLYFFGGIASFISSYIIGRMSDRYGKRSIFVWSCLISIIPMYLITNMEPHPLWWIFSITTSFFIVMSGRNVPAVAMSTAATEARYRGSFMSLVSSTQNFSAAIATGIAGFIIHKNEAGRLENYPLVGLLAITFTFVSIFASRYLVLPDTESKASPRDAN